MASQPVDRRALLAGGLVVGGALGTASAVAKTGQVGRPGFLWGTAGSSYQIEGGAVGSEIWLLEHVNPTIFRTPSGDADDVYNRVREDLALAAALGYNAHRLSIEWSRIEPEPGEISQAGLAYYRGALEECRRLKLAPVVTYNHWTVPRWFAERGGFETTDGVAPFIKFCELLTHHMGDLMETAATFNEANIRAQLSWVPGIRIVEPISKKMLAAAAAKSGSPEFSSPILADFHVQQPIMLEAHARAYDAIKKIRPDLPVGVTLSLSDDQAVGADSGIARKHAEVWAPWMKVQADWLGVQTYSRARVGATADLPSEQGVEVTQAGYEFWPQALGAVIRRVAAESHRPIYVTENGIATDDDTRRVAYIREAVLGMQSAMADGIDVRGYLHWSLLDNWEWLFGYTQRFGLVSVDRTTFKRTPKPSSAYLGRIARTGRV